ncbi:MAG: sigma-70 family RNA polymerase sigma factor [Bacteroidota bacterium]
MSRSDYKIVTSINQKELSGYKYIYDHYYASLCSFSCRFSIRRSDAEDIVQDVILRLWRGDSIFNSLNALTSYLYKSVRNSSLNAIRNNSKMLDTDLSANSSNNLKVADMSILDVMIEEEYYRQIHIAVNNLSPKRRKVILLSMEGLSNKKIAEKIGVSVNTVKTLKFKAYRCLREYLLK